MSMPTVTFPLTQEQVREKYEELTLHFRSLSAETRQTVSLLKELRNWCDHKASKNGCCPDCGLDTRD